MRLSTTEPLASQLTTKILGGIAAALLGALLAGLCAGVGAFGARMTPPLDAHRALARRRRGRLRPARSSWDCRSR